MRAGRLRHRLALQSRTEVRDAYGASTPTWATQKTVWGAIEPLSGKELFAQNQSQAEGDVRIIIRFYSDIDETWRITNDSIIYVIHSIQNHDERDAMLVLNCSTGVKEE